MQPTHPTTPSDDPGRSLADLAAAAASGDRASFSHLHKRLSGGLRRLFLDRSSGRAEVADDLIQKTWVGVWQSLSRGRYDPSRSAISTFVYAVAHKMWLQHLRSHPAAPRATGGDSSPAESIETEIDFASDLGLAEVLDAIRSCLRGQSGELSSDDREVLRLVGSGASDRDLAAKLGVSPSTANARKRAALERLRRFLASSGHRPAERIAEGSE